MSTRYNELVERQRALTATIQEALGTIASALEAKEHAAEEQKTLQASEIGVRYPEHSVADVRRKVIDEVVRRMEQRASTPLRDWTCRFALPGGNLED